MSTFVAELNKLKNIQQNLEKNKNVWLEQFSKFDSQLELCDGNSRALQMDKLQNDLKAIVVPLRMVNSLIRQENISNINLKSVKKEMTTIQNNIENLKYDTKTSLELLKQDEEKLSEDIQAFEQKIQEWNKPISNFPKKYVAKRTSTATPENISQEVKDFMEYVAANDGHENGWSVDDHNLFVKARAKTKDVQKLAEILHALLPDISVEEVIAHVKWYEKYVELKEKQKDSIKNWRNNKSNTKSTPRARNKSSPANVSVKNLSKSFTECEDKEEMQRKIAMWKAQKRAQMMKQQQEKIQEELKRKQLEKQQKEKQKQLKAEVDNWRHIKKEVEEAEKIRKTKSKLRERENKAARANKLIKQFQNQDEIFVQRKLQLCRVRSKSAEIEVVTNKNEAPRDPERLFKPTRGWILRTYGADNSGSGNDKLSLQAIPKLGIPEWRKNVL